MNKRRLSLIFIFLTIMTASNVFCQEKYNVVFHGIIAPYSQDNQKNITQDLISAHIRSIQDISFTDKRDSNLQERFNKLSDKEIAALSDESIFSLISSPSEDGSMNIDFFARIDKVDEENWKCTFYAKNLYSGKIESLSNNFESYYKVLAEAKRSISELLSKSTGLDISSTQLSKRPPREPINEVAMTVEGVSGTWEGEEGITKIILMRSGRGFVIFNNGASMNITISVEKNEQDHKILKITQQGNFNASFYPDIPRHKVLAAADSANPIEWNFVLTGTSTLIGFKNSLSLDDQQNVVETKNRIKWTKVN